MALWKLNVTRNQQGRHALNRVISFFGSLVVTYVFVKISLGMSLEKPDWAVLLVLFLGYPSALVILYLPVLGLKYLQAWKDIKWGGSSSVEQPSAQAPGPPAGGV